LALVDRVVRDLDPKSDTRVPPISEIASRYETHFVAWDQRTRDSLHQHVGSALRDHQGVGSLVSADRILPFRRQQEPRSRSGASHRNPTLADERNDGLHKESRVNSKLLG
jgi:hypothetical protein